MPGGRDLGVGGPSGSGALALGALLLVVLLDYRVALTVILNVAVAVFPLESVASHVTRVLPSGKRLPDLGSHPTGTTPSVPS